MKKILRLRTTWFPIWLISVLMLIMICIYLPAFGGGTNNLTNAPLIVVNEDKGPAGDDILLYLVDKYNGHSFKWSVVGNQEQAMQDIRDNEAYGALVIPSDFSNQLDELHEVIVNDTGKTEAATLKILLNEGVGPTATMIADNTLQQVVTAASAEFSRNLKQELKQKGLSVSADKVGLAENPVKAATVNALGISKNLNNGMTPFVLVLISSIAGIMGANMIYGYLQRGNGTLKNTGIPLSNSQLLKMELLFGAMLAFGVAAASQLAVFGFFGSTHASSIWIIFIFCFFCCYTMYLVFKTLALLFGGWGMLVMFPVNIMGIFSSGGALPLSTLPEVHRVFSAILPTRYMVDGMRALLYYGGRMQAGLGSALLAISIYFVAAIIIIMVFVDIKKRKENASSTNLS
ncbi:ABC transporter permease [Lysinibacillus yapensis]|uniref:ABC transporter permease n=1 Tax=Ureibacillus yapensis TaxID=2304605 RepID=A0A396S894_9BACL|nr:ABC transporter permease [Lysinibacillus yapensis]RHW36717.1 ABC transporter permease [Lysinibacillus yapensis]